jgi:hypothetical protein
MLEWISDPASGAPSRVLPGGLLGSPRFIRLLLHYIAQPCDAVPGFLPGLAQLGVITPQAIRRGSFTSVRQHTATIGAFIDA